MYLYNLASFGNSDNLFASSLSFSKSESFLFVFFLLFLFFFPELCWSIINHYTKNYYIYIHQLTYSHPYIPHLKILNFPLFIQQLLVEEAHIYQIIQLDYSAFKLFSINLLLFSMHLHAWFCIHVPYYREGQFELSSLL